MGAAWPMTGLATDVDLFVVRIELISFCVVAFFNVSAMALCAAGIPVEIATCPMQGIARQNGLFFVKVIPTLSASLDRTRIPCNGQCLQATTWQWQQILLKRFDAKNILNRKCLECARCVISGDEIIITAPRERRRHAMIVKLCIIKVTQYGVGCGFLHGQVVMRIRPVGCRLAVAVSAGAVTNIISDHGRRCDSAVGGEANPDGQ